MDEKQLREKLKTRASNNVEKKIKEFKIAVVKALLELDPAIGRGWDPESTAELASWNDDFREILAVVASEDTRKGWPGRIWKDEEARLLKEVMSQLGAVERLLLVQKEETIHEPGPEKKKDDKE